MTIDETRSQVQLVFREVFSDDTLVLRDDMTANDVEGWDSLMHVNLIIAIEKRFGVRFATAEISRLNDHGQNLRSLLEMVKRKCSS
jgi:acyl carrier protein